MATKIGGIYVEVRGDSTQFAKDMRQLRDTAKKSGKEVSDSLNTAIKPTQASKSISSLATNLSGLSQAAKAPRESFKVTAREISKSFADVAQRVGMTEKEYAKLQERMLRNTAMKNSERGLRSIARQADLSGREIRALAVQMGYTNKEAKQMATNISGASRQMSSFGNVVKGAMAYFAVDRVIAWTGAIINAMDAYTELENKIKLSTAGQSQLNAVMGETYQVAERTRSSWSATVDLYARLERSTRDLGYSQEELLAVTKSVNQAVTVSGTTAAAAEAALFQLGQGLAAGALRGQELNSVMEQTPRLAQAIADGLGVSIGQLRELGAQGEITSRQVIEAMRSQADVIESEFNQTTATAAQGQVRLSDAFTRLIGVLDDLSGTSESVASSLQSLADAIDFVADKMEDLGPPAKNSFGVMFDELKKNIPGGIGLIFALQDGIDDLKNTMSSENGAVVSGLIDWGAVHEDQAKLDALYRDSTEKAAAWAKRRGEILTTAEQETIDKIIAAEKKAAQERKKIAEDLADAQAQATHQMRMESLRERERIRQLEEQKIRKKLDEEIRLEEEAQKERERILEKEIEHAIQEHEKQLEEQRQITERAMQNIQDSMADTFYDIFKDIGNGWDNLWESMKNFALRMIANMAAQAAMNAIVVPVFFQPSGGGVGGIFSGLFGGGGGGLNLGGGFPSFGGGFNIPGMDWLSGIMGMNMPGTGTTVFGSGAAAGMPVTYGGLGLGSMIGYGALGSLGYGMLGGMMGLPQGGMSGLGSGVGGALGAWGGSALMGGAMGGPLGAIVGALLGGLGGSLFGGDSFKGIEAPYVKGQTNKWGDTDIDWTTFSGVDTYKEQGEQIIAALEASLGQTFSGIEDMVGENWSSLLENISISFGRDVSEHSERWAFHADQDIEALIAEAMESLKKSAIHATSFAIDQAGQELIESEDFLSTWGKLSEFVQEELQPLVDAMDEGLLGEEAQKMAEEIQALQDELAKIGDGAQASNAVDELNKQISELMKKIAESVDAEDALEYAEQLKKLKDLLGGLQGAWDTVHDAIEQILNPMSEVARITQNANDMIDQWIETLRELGFAEEELAKIEEKRQEIIDALLAKMKMQFDAKMRLREEQLYGSEASNEYLRMQIQHEQELADVIAQFGEGSEQHLRLLALHAEEMAQWHRYMEYQTKVVARETWEGAANAYLSALKDELAELQDTYNTAKSNYANALRSALSELQAEYNAAKQTYLNLLHEEINAYKNLANTLSQAINQIEAYRRSMWVAQESPLGAYDQMRYLRGLYQSSMSGAMAGDRDALGRVASDASGYLSARRALSTDHIAYAREFAKANLQLLAAQTMAEDELSDTQKMIALLEDIVAETEGTKENVTDLDEARTQYEDLRKRLDENWFERELYAIEGTNFGVEDLNKLQADYYAAKRALDTSQHSEHIAKLESLLGYTASIEQLLADFLESGGFKPPPDPTPPDQIGILLQDSGFKDIASVYGKINPDWTSGGQAWTYSALNRAVGQSLANLPDTTDEQVKAWGIGKTKSQFESDLNYLSSLLDQVRAGDMLFGDPSGYKSMRNEDYYKTIAQRYGWPSQGTLEDQAELRQGIDDSLDKIAKGDDAMRAFLDSVGLTHVTTQQWYNDIHWLDGVLGQVESGLRRFATGGIATGPRTGYLAELHGTEAVVPLSNGRSIPVTLGAGEITSELRDLRADLNRIGHALAKHTSDTARYLERWEYGGIPEERVTA